MRQLRPVTKYINIKGKTNCIQVPPTGYLQMNSQTDENKGSYHMMEKLLRSPQNWGRGELGRTGPSIKENKNTMTLKKPKNHGSQTQALHSLALALKPHVASSAQRCAAPTGTRVSMDFLQRCPVLALG